MEIAIDRQSSCVKPVTIVDRERGFEKWWVDLRDERKRVIFKGGVENGFNEFVVNPEFECQTRARGMMGVS